MEMKIHVDSKTYIDQVIALWRKNSKTLGFFPNGAFNDHSALKQIIVAIGSSEQLIGYLAYRISNGYAIIVHLCTSDDYRGAGVAKLLLMKLYELTTSFNGIKLKCRRDYDLSRFWPKHGFCAKGETIGRSIQGYPLTIWVKENNHPDLFTEQATVRQGTTICVCLDANVFYGLSSDDNWDDESKVLVNDWYPDDVTLVLTDEIFNEIDRNSNVEERMRQRNYANTFQVLKHKYDEYIRIYEEIRARLVSRDSINDESDARQVAKCISCGIKLFVTRDTKLLSVADDILEIYNVQVLRPSDLIIHVDELLRKDDYCPSRILGTQLKRRLIKSGEQGYISDIFSNSNPGEGKTVFQSKLQTIIGMTPKSEIEIWEFERDQIALIACIHDKNELVVPILRIRKGTLYKTISRHVLLDLKLKACRNNCGIVSITDQNIDSGIRELLYDEHFFNEDGVFKCLCIKGYGDISAAKKLLNEYTVSSSRASVIDENLIDLSSSQICLKIEKKIWPFKLIGTNYSNFIIPIKPNYAMQLFDYNQAETDLFGASTLIFNRELIYYRSSIPMILDAPSRILWYVSKDARYSCSGQIRAYSHLDCVDVDLVKRLFHKYKRYGIYSWKDVFKTAKHDVNRSVMAIRFSNTQMLDKPIDLPDMKSLFSRFGVVNNIQSPIRISNELFDELIRNGFDRV